MRSNLFKLSAVTATILTSFGANAALYNVYHYAPVNNDSAKTFGVAIQPSTSENCWIDPTACTDSSFEIAYEEQIFNQGYDYREEAPFRHAKGAYYAISEQRFDDYCRAELGYSETSCDSWAHREFALGHGKEGDVNNSLAYIGGTAFKASKNNVVINSFTSASDALGTYYTDSIKRSTAFKGATDLAFDTAIYDRSKVWAEAEGILVGSVSKQYNTSNDFYSYAAFWSNVGTNPEVVSNANDTPSNDYFPLGSARDIVKCVAGANAQCVADTIYAVGYNSNSDRRPAATIYTVTPSPLSVVPSRLFESDKTKYESSVLTSINPNGYAIGEAKHADAFERSYANSLFYTTMNSASPTFFTGSIFFSGANGKAGAINKYNEVVGQIDYEKHAEIGGGPRAKRAFVTTIGNVSTSPLLGQSRYLDDLTMGSNNGALATNNQYRIIDATDINDAGVISGTALYCDGGYDSQAINAKCQGGAQGVEKIVAVKLVPLNGADSTNIQPRPVDVTTIERQGGSLGWLALGLLALLGFRRKQ